MAENKNIPTSTAADREIVSKRLVKASRETVFEAWTNPKYLALWWGPKGATNTFHEHDLRLTGIWRFIMHGPDGVDYPNKSVFVEISKPGKLVFDHVTLPKYQMVATFTEESGKTLVTMKMTFKSANEFPKIKKSVIETNEQCLDRLEAQLRKIP